jgi:hypothetical protein
VEWKEFIPKGAVELVAKVAGSHFEEWVEPEQQPEGKNSASPIDFT